MTASPAPDPSRAPVLLGPDDLEAAKVLEFAPGPRPGSAFYKIDLKDGAGEIYILAQAQEHAEEQAQEEHAEEDGGEHGPSESYGMPAEFPNVYSLIAAYRADPGEHHGEGREHTSPFWVNPVFALFQTGIFLAIILRILSKRSVTNPSKAQVAVEMIFMGLYDFFAEVIGKKNARKYVPYVATLWLFIFINYLAALIPGLKTPWATYFRVGEMGLLVPLTLSLGLVTFFWVNGHALKEGGVRHYLWHLCGSPTDTVTWLAAPLMFLLELIGTFIKPISLSLRLFGNTLGGDKLLAVFLGLGMTLVALIAKTDTPFIGIPLHFPFMFLELLVGVIQATVFSMLAAVYVTMLLPHDDHGHSELEGEESKKAEA
ncbi:F0F1 ATP synthase subunit A [Candidatus Sumerlaeota bacterium]|nr:F0F1 ATP synthase subunit A [Candidatus Sumerlaeota bacterium]